MRQHLRSWSRAFGAATLVGALGATGCGDTTTVTDLAPSDFPGSSIADAFLSDDGQAFTNSGVNVNANAVQVFRNVANDDAILIFAAPHVTGSNSTGLFASFFDGSRFTEPVSILGSDEDGSSARQSIGVLFLNTAHYSGTSGGATSAGRARNGDALIVYTSVDIDDVATPAAIDRDANRRVYATYFDKSERSKAASGSVVHGFDRVAHTIDFEHVVTGNTNDSNVGSVGFVSDSLHGSHAIGLNAGTLSGDETSFAQIVFRKAPSTNATVVADRWFAVPFDLGQTGNAFVAQSGPTSGLLNPAVGTFEDVDTVSTRLVVNDGFAIWTANNVDTMGQDTVLTATSFGASSGTAINLGSDATANLDTSSLPTPESVYGPDHGLDALYVLFQESGFTNGMTGSRAGDADLMVAQIDAGATTRTVAEVDAFKDTIDVANGDLDVYTLRSGGNGTVFRFDSVINKDSGAIVVQLEQLTNDAGDVNDASATLGAPGVNRTSYLQVIQTGRPAASLSTSVLAAPLKVPALESSGDTGTGNVTTQQGVGAFRFQIGLPNGAAASAGGANHPSDAWQSNANRVFFSYTQFNDVSAAGNVPNELRLFTTGIEITPGADPAAPTATLVRNSVTSAAVTFPMTSPGSGSDDNTWSNNFAPQVIDRGVAVGDVLTFFVSNDNHVTDGSVMGSFPASRLYVWDGSTTTLVSSAGATDLQTVSGQYRTVWVAGRVHVAFTEFALGAFSSEQVIGARSIATNAAALAAVPAFSAAPSYLDLPESGAVAGFMLLTSANTVGVYFQENGHLYYNQTTGDAAHYRMSGGLADPTLIDNDAWHDVVTGVNLYLNDGVNQLRDSFVLYTKRDITNNANRGFIRVHD